MDWSACFWTTVGFALRNRDSDSRSRAHFLSIVDAVLRDANKTLVGRSPVFRVLDRTLDQTRILPGEQLRVEVILPQANPLETHTWWETLCHHLSNAKQHYSLVDDAPRLEHHRLDTKPLSPALFVSSVTLAFHTPLAFTPTLTHPDLPKAQQSFSSWQIDSHEFVKRLAHRAKKLFGLTIDEAWIHSTASDLKTYPLYWRYARVNHASASTPGTAKLIKGCVGELVVEGDLHQLWPLLMLCEHVNAGSELSWGQGYFVLSADAGPLSSWAGLEARLAQALESLCAKNSAYSVQLAAEFGNEIDVAKIASLTASAVRGSNYRCEPTYVVHIPKKNGASREIETLSALDATLHKVLADLLTPVAERTLEPQALAYRPQKSRETAKTAIEDAIAEGYDHVLITDIDDFFPSVNHDLLKLALVDKLPSCEATFVAQVLDCARVPLGSHGVSKERVQGLCQGSALSPLLANLFLDHIDEALLASNIRFVRYADDFAILSKTDADLVQAKALLEERLAGLGLHLKPSKQWIGLAQGGFEFLGFQFGATPRDTQAPVELLKRAVYVTETGTFLSIQGQALRVEKKGQPGQVLPLTRISSVHVTARASLTTPLLQVCYEEGIPISVLLDGPHNAAVWVPDRRSFFQTAYEQTKRHDALSETARLEVAKALVRAKVRNGIAMLSQRYAPGFAAWSAVQEQHLETLDQTLTLAGVRGVEGYAAKSYFERWASTFTDPFFSFKGRTREQPDAINSLLNFSYSLLFSRINLAIRSRGLNPYLGYLHEDDQRFETLVVDVQEPFRAHIDRLIARLIGLRTLQIEHFQQTERGTRLTTQGIHLLIRGFETMLHTRPKQRRGSPALNLTPAEAIEAQIRNLKDHATHGKPIHWYRIIDEDDT